MFIYIICFIIGPEKPHCGVLDGNTVIGIIVYKMKTKGKPIKFFIVNMATSDLMLPIFAIPHLIQAYYVDSWGPVVLLARSFVSCLPSYQIRPLLCLLRAWFS